MFWNTGNNLSF